jgi:hypothetical protein
VLARRNAWSFAGEEAMETLISRPFCSHNDQQLAIDLVMTCRAVEQIDPWPLSFPYFLLWTYIYRLLSRLRNRIIESLA